MPQGVIIKDELGNITLDTTTATGLILGSINVTGTQTVTVTNIEFSVSSPFYIIATGVQQLRRNFPTITVSGQVMTVKGNDTANTAGAYTIYYGVY